MDNNQNFSNLLLVNIDNEIPIAFELIAPRKDATTITSRSNLSKSSMNHLPAENFNKLDNSDKLITLLEENIVFLKEPINQKDRIIDSLLNSIIKQN